MNDWAENLKEIDPILFNPKRLLIMSLLIAIGSASQSELQKSCQLTWGAITAHLNQLEKAGYVVQKHELTLKGPRLQVEITEQGVMVYKDTLVSLQNILGELNTTTRNLEKTMKFGGRRMRRK